MKQSTILAVFLAALLFCLCGILKAAAADNAYFNVRDFGAVGDGVSTAVFAPDVQGLTIHNSPALESLKK